MEKNSLTTLYLLAMELSSKRYLLKIDFFEIAVKWGFSMFLN